MSSPRPRTATRPGCITARVPAKARQWIEKHPAYRRLEEVAFSQYGLAAMSHRGGVLGWPRPLPRQSNTR
jgi:hypothetical protein